MWARVYAFGFLSSLYLDQFLWMVYLLHLGYSPAFVGVQYALMQAGRLILDVPSSMFADRFGARQVLAVGAAAKLASAVLYLLAPWGPVYPLVGALVTAVALTLPSGVDLAYVRGLADRSRGDRTERSALRRFADYVAMQRLAGIGSGIVGGLIASVSFAWLYIADAFVSLLLLATTLALPTVDPASHSVHGIGRHQAPPLGLHALLRSPARRIWLLGAAAALLWAFSSVGTEYSQSLLNDLGLHPLGISIAFAAAATAMWAATVWTGRLASRGRERALRLALWGYPLAAGLRALAVPGWPESIGLGISGLTVARGASGVGALLLEQRLLDEAPATLRATTLSLVNTLQMGLQLVLFALLGLVATRQGMPIVFAVLATGLALAALALSVALRTAHPRPLGMAAGGDGLSDAERPS